MQNRIGALLGVFVAATIHLAVGVRSARACSPIYSAPGKSCIEIDLYTPSASFPLNLVDEIRVAQSSVDSNFSMLLETFELSAPLTIARQSGDGYVEVAFELVSEPDLVPGFRSVRLMDPMPGDYIVTSVDHTCSAMPSPIGEGALVGSFSLTASAAVPTVLGTATWEGQERSTRTFHVGGGLGADCSVLLGRAIQGVLVNNTFRVPLADEVLPWTGVLETSIEVDGKEYSGFGAAGDSTTRELTVSIEHLCSADDPAFFDAYSNRLTEGKHTLKLIGRVGHFAPFESTEVAFEIDCSASGGSASGGSASGSASGACSAAPGPRSAGNGPAWWALGATLLLRRARRVLRPR
jgi:hypothetical protein